MSTHLWCTRFAHAPYSRVPHWSTMSSLYEFKGLANTAENDCACVNLTEICLANVVSSVSKVVKNSKWKRHEATSMFCLFCENFNRNNECENLKTINDYSLHVQEIVLCKKMNQWWLSINLLYKKFFNWLHTKIFFVGSYDPHFSQ
jgi:hypothetical protein